MYSRRNDVGKRKSHSEMPADECERTGVKQQGETVYLMLYSWTGVYSFRQCVLNLYRSCLFMMGVVRTTTWKTKIIIHIKMMLTEVI